MELNTETLQLAKAFEFMTLTKKDAVNKFGTTEQKNHFEKYKKFTNKKIGEALVKTLNQLYLEVDETVKVGRGYGYKLGAVREEIAERERNLGKNETNGKYKPSTKHLDALILAHLENNLKNDIEIEKSIVKWMREFNMINDMSYEVYSSRFNDRKKNKVLSEIEDALQADNHRVVDASYKFIQNDIRNQRSVLLTSLNRMKNHGIIETFDRPKAMRLNEVTGFPMNKIDVDMTVYNNYTNKKRELREELEIDEKQINNFMYEKAEVKRRIEKYESELKLFLTKVEVKDTYGNVSTVSISNIWIDLAIIVKATRQKTMEYLHKFHVEVLKDYLEYKEEATYLSNQAIEYKSRRTDERFKTAKEIKNKNIEYKIAEDEYEQNRWAIGRSRYAPNHYEQQARNSKEEFMKVIEILDRVYADKFVIDEDRIKETLVDNYSGK